MPDGIVASVASVIDCNKKCEEFSDSKCKFWTYVPTRKICFLLSSCDKKPEEGFVSGEKGCKVPSKTFTVFNLITKDPPKVTDCEAEWEPTDTCPKTTIGTGGEIPKAGSATVTYFTAPPSIGCTKIKKVSCKWGTETCETADINVPIPTLFVKTKKGDDTKCEIANNAKNAE